MKNKQPYKISFLGNGKPIKGIPSFLNTPIRAMKPSPLFMKESTKSKTLKLSPFGDADLDGTPNKYDCNPWNPGKDGLMDTILSAAQKLKIVETPNKKGKSTADKARDFEEMQRQQIAKAKRQKAARGYFKEQSKQISRDKSLVSDLASGLVRTLGLPDASLEKKKGRLTGAYSKQSKREQRKLTGQTLKLAGLLTPAGTISRPSGKTGTGSRGRPKGASGKYYIPGVGAVGVYQYRAYLRKQRKINRLQRKYGSQPNQEQLDSRYQQIVNAQEDNPEAFAQAVPAAQYEQLQSVDEQRTVAQPNITYTGDLDQIKTLQLQMQQRDNVLNAPSINQGQLQNTGGDILSDSGRPNILQAPNVNLGQMRNLSPRSPVEVGDRPISNPYGDTYTDIDPISGKPILRRRPSEKWMTGEAL